MADCTKAKWSKVDALKIHILAAQKKGESGDPVATLFAKYAWESDQCEILHAQQEQLASQLPGTVEFSDTEAAGVVKNDLCLYWMMLQTACSLKLLTSQQRQSE